MLRSGNSQVKKAKRRWQHQHQQQQQKLCAFIFLRMALRASVLAFSVSSASSSTRRAGSKLHVSALALCSSSNIRTRQKLDSVPSLSSLAFNDRRQWGSTPLVFTTCTDNEAFPMFRSECLRAKFHSLSTALMATAGDSDPLSVNVKKSKKNKDSLTRDTKKTNTNGPKRKKKIEVNPQWQKEYNVTALTAEFDKIARKEGFDTSTSYFAKDNSFEDDFVYDNDDGESGVGNHEMDDLNNHGFEPDIKEENDEEFLNMDDNSYNSEGEQSMDERIADAKSNRNFGRVTVPVKLDTFSREVTAADLQKLGFRKELNPFGNDETPRKEQFKLTFNAMVCSGCGANFQCNNEDRPGFLPQEKHSVQVKLSKLEELQKLQEKSESFEWSPEDEIEWLIRTGGNTTEGPGAAVAKDIDIQSMADQLDLDLVALAEKKVICKRCHGLQNFGEVQESLRPGWTDEPLLSQEAFRDLLKPIREKKAVIIALVDLFDFSGSVLPELDAIVGENPVIIAANKADLLPSQMGQVRAENWVRRELEYIGIKSIANIGGAVRLVSCKTGFGVTQLLDKARGVAEELDCDVYVVGAANAGKSTLINRILDKKEEKTAAFKFKGIKKTASNATLRKGVVTTSPLPGTTLKFIKVDLGNGKSLYDTPGLLVPGTFTQKLTLAELKMVVPKKQVEAVTYRIAGGKCVLVGGLAKIEVSEESKPFLFTFFVSNDIKLHPTDADKADSTIAKHAGVMLTPPLEPGPERMKQIGEFESHEIDIEGAGWKEAAADITLRGLGWVSVTGAGTAKVRISVPKGVGISVRPPLMPFDVWEVAARYTGGRTVRKAGKSKSGKRRKGVGRR